MTISFAWKSSLEILIGNHLMMNVGQITRINLQPIGNWETYLNLVTIEKD